MVSGRSIVCQQEPLCLAAVTHALEVAQTSKSEALRLMLLVYEKFPDPRLCFNLGRLSQQSGALLDAAKYYRQFLDSDEEQSPEQRTKARDFLQQVETKLQPPPQPVVSQVTPVRQSATCAKWNFARAATLGFSAGMFGSGLLAGTVVAAYPDRPAPFVFSGRGYSAVGFGAAALAMIPGGLALRRPDLFSTDGSAEPNGTCWPTKSRWTVGRGAAVGVFSGLLFSALSGAISVSAAAQQTCYSGIDTDGQPLRLACNFSPFVTTGWAFSGAWALLLTLSLAVPSPGSSR